MVGSISRDCFSLWILVSACPELALLCLLEITASPGQNTAPNGAAGKSDRFGIPR
jgi:hypothetical protein